MLNAKLKPIIFTQLKPSLWQYKLARALRDQGQKTVMLSIIKNFEERELRKAFDDIISLKLENLKPVTILKKLFLETKSFFQFFINLLKIKPKAAICEGAPHYLSALFIKIFKNRCPRIYFPYDMNFSRFTGPGIYFPKREVWGEKYCFRNCDAILHKSDKRELKLLPKSFKIDKKPTLYLPAYTSKYWYAGYDIKKKISYKSRDINIVNVSFFTFDSSLYKSMAPESKEIVEQKIHLHLYGNYEKIANRIVEEITKNDKNLKKYIHIHNPVAPEKLSYDISKYDYGLYQTGFSKNIKSDAVKYISGNAISSYLEAGLPIIVKNENLINSLMIKNNKIGISLNSLKNIKQEIRKVNYDELSRNVVQFREKFSFEENTNKIINFIDNLSDKFFNKTH